MDFQVATHCIFFFVHSITKVFVGGRNRIYQLSPDLDIVATAITGPKNDSKDCSFNECTQNLTRKLTDNINKVLLIDYSTSRLITCGSLFQGICSVRSLQNVSLPEQDVAEAIVANIESEYHDAYTRNISILDKGNIACVIFGHPIAFSSKSFFFLKITKPFSVSQKFRHFGLKFIWQKRNRTGINDDTNYIIVSLNFSN